MQKAIVSDTSCLILLEKIGRLDLLAKLFSGVIVTQVIADEFGLNLPEYISIENPQNTTYQSILETFLDKGEASAIALCLEKDNCLLIIDDSKGRKEAQQLRIPITGTIGVLILAKQIGHITSVKNEINKLDNTNFRISESIRKYALEICGEI